MEKNKALLYTVVVALVAVSLGYGVARFVISERLEDATAQIKLDVAAQQTTISSLSEVMARGGVDEVTASVIKDCAADERDRFDVLLGRLGNSLPRTELLELSRLFDRCASYYARQKAVMAARFEREIEVYDSYIMRLPTLLPDIDLSPYALPVWQELATLERAQSQVFETLVQLQGQIIDALVAGKTPTDPALIELLTSVREAQEMQTYNIAKMAELRTQLPSAI